MSWKRRARGSPLRTREKSSISPERVKSTRAIFSGNGVHVDKATIADTMEKIATLLELKGENPFKIRAYTNGARSIETWGGNVGDLTNDETLQHIPGIGKGIASVIKELVATGSSTFFEQLRAEFPAGILELFTISGLGAKKIKALHEQLQVSSIAQLKEACESGRVAELPGFGKTTQEKLCKAIAERAKHAGVFQLGTIAAEAETLRDFLRALDATIEVSIAGSYRRRKELVRDLDFIVSTNDAGGRLAGVCRASAGRVGNCGRRHEIERATAFRNSMRPARRRARGVSVCAELLYREQGAQRRGAEPRAAARLDIERISAGAGADRIRESERRNAKPPEPIPEIHDESDLYRAFGLDYIQPELRENCGEFEAAAEGQLPRLIEKENHSRHVSLPHDRERWTQLARGNGRAAAGARAAISRHRRSQPQLGRRARSR